MPELQASTTIVHDEVVSGEAALESVDVKLAVEE